MAVCALRRMSWAATDGLLWYMMSYAVIRRSRTISQLKCLTRPDNPKVQEPVPLFTCATPAVRHFLSFVMVKACSRHTQVQSRYKYND